MKKIAILSYQYGFAFCIIRFVPRLCGYTNRTYCLFAEPVLYWFAGIEPKQNRCRSLYDVEYVISGVSYIFAHFDILFIFLHPISKVNLVVKEWGGALCSAPYSIVRFK